MDNLDKLITDIEKKYQNLNPKIKRVNHPDNQVNNSANNNNIDSFLSDLQGEKLSQKNQQKSPDLLTEIESKFQSAKQSSGKKESNSQDLLTEIEAKFQTSKNQSTSKKSNSEDLIIEIESKFQQQKVTVNQKKATSSNILTDIESQFQQKKSSSKPPSKSNLAEQGLDSIAENFAKKQAEIKQHNKTDNLEEIRRQELEKQRQEKQLIRKAEQWLKNLDPYSDEGFWFEQFALSYPSKLDAAIDYLRALQ
ncbi:salt stress protein, Slr1339 family [Geminocystis herdmanii]|uniref:salt stress protein, Slr1339 family n=1 Tax=Geminocystis herdmanii TaxID=669359 RepID=UPI000349623D|nr:hypothetical protein [Geminocystis herdmanii]